MMRVFAVTGNLISYKIVNRVFDNVLVDESEIFVNFCKRGIRKLPQSFSLVEVGPPNNDFLGPTVLSKKC